MKLSTTNIILATSFLSQTSGFSTVAPNTIIQRTHPAANDARQFSTSNSLRVPSSLNVATVKGNNDRSSRESSSKFFPEGIVKKEKVVDQDADALSDYNRGLFTIGFITLLFSSNSPALHAAFVNSASPPPVLLLNAATSTIALMGLVTFGPLLNQMVPLPKTLDTKEADSNMWSSIQAGTELGVWKTLGTTANLYGLSMTTASHGAFLIQLTTLIVPAYQGLTGVPIPNRIWTAIGLALAGITMFTQDAVSGGDLASNSSLIGDALCALAAVFYATYDLRLFDLGKKIAPLPLIRTKITMQAALSCGLLAFAHEGGLSAAWEYTENLLASPSDLFLIGSAALWSGLAINAIAPFLQVGGQQTIGASRAQVLYASQPLWASLMSFALLHETLGEKGMMGSSLFLIAIFFAATAESPDPNCGKEDCEV